MQEVVGSNTTKGTKIYFSYFTLLEWNVKNWFVKLIIKKLISSSLKTFYWNTIIVCRTCGKDIILLKLIIIYDLLSIILKKFFYFSLTMAYDIGRNVALERNKTDFLWNWNYFSSSIQILYCKTGTNFCIWSNY